MENNDNKDIKQKGVQNRDDIKILGTIDHRDQILRLVKKPEKEKSIHTRSYINELVLRVITPVLEEKGQYFSVKSKTINGRKFKPGYCYYNSGTMMLKGFGYVEGYVIDKSQGNKIGHSWNVDKNGNHIDFTYPNSDQFDYFGIIIPKDIVLEVGLENGRTWFSVLVFRQIF